MEREVKRYYKYKKNIVFLLIGSGIWPSYRQHPELLRTFLSVCSASSSAVLGTGVVAFCKVHFTNISTLTKGLGLMLGFMSTFLKVVILAVRKRDMLSLDRGVSAQFERDLENPEYRPHLLAYFPAFARFFYIFNYSVCLNIGMVVFGPFLALRKGKYVRAFPVHVPFKYEPGGVVHWLIWLYEAIAGYFLCTTTSGVDSVFGLYALHMVGELRLLSHKLQNLKSSRDYPRDLKECVERQTMLHQSQQLMQRVFGFLTIWLALTCAIIECTIIFQSTEAKGMSVYRAIYLVCYWFLKLVQAYMYAWFGNVITIESELCLQSIYNSAWPDSPDLRFRNDVLIMQSQNVMEFNAVGVMIVRLDMFTKILQTSVSYFFLLRTLEEGLGDK